MKDLLLNKRTPMIPEHLRTLTNTIYVVDKNYTIVDYNEGYKLFAIANEGEDILEKWPIGSNILLSVPDIIRDFIKKMYDDVLHNNKTIEHEYDCHSPTVFRRFKMRILPLYDKFALNEHALIESSALSQPCELSDSDIKSKFIDGNGIIHQCCHCRKIQSSSDLNNWQWVVSLIKRNSKYSGKVSHTICPVCMFHYFQIE
jgi:hypothetical protein